MKSTRHTGGNMEFDDDGHKLGHTGPTKAFGDALREWNNRPIARFRRKIKRSRFLSWMLTIVVIIFCLLILYFLK